MWLVQFLKQKVPPFRIGRSATVKFNHFKLLEKLLLTYVHKPYLKRLTSRVVAEPEGLGYYISILCFSLYSKEIFQKNNREKIIMH